nr:MAG TPA: hypothetical protein [Caudoviricetes sp.]DAU23109.1 MAG TPA: hypothetical protein [Caudoviricetes sp.]
MKVAWLHLRLNKSLKMAGHSQTSALTYQK